jgi:hypothetical protein
MQVDFSSARSFARPPDKLRFAPSGPRPSVEAAYPPAGWLPLGDPNGVLYLPFFLRWLKPALGEPDAPWYSLIGTVVAREEQHQFVIGCGVRYQESDNAPVS